MTPDPPPPMQPPCILPLGLDWGMDPGRSAPVQRVERSASVCPTDPALGGTPSWTEMFRSWATSEAAQPTAFRRRNRRAPGCTGRRHGNAAKL